MNKLLLKYLKGDFVLWFVFFTLCILSIIEMYSASSTLAFKAANHTAPMLRHVGFLALGIALAFGIHLIPYKYIRVLSYGGVIVSFFFLILVLFRGQTMNDASRWLAIGGIQFQPSELAKLSLVIVVADLISRIKNSETDEKKYFWWIIGISAVICVLILLENFSTAALLFLVVLILLFIGQASWKRMGIVLGTLLVMALAGYGLVKVIPEKSMPDALDRAYTWVARIDRFFEGKSADEENKYVIVDENRQMMHGKIAIARGGAFGRFPGNSIERDYLSHAYSDFIYAIIVEEMGLVGGIFVILLYLVLLFRAGSIATKCTQVFPAMLVIGLALIIVLQAFINMSVATSLGPVTGQPLPLISMGGTSIMITCIYFGIILGVTRQIKEEEKQGNNVESDSEGMPIVDLEEV